MIKQIPFYSSLIGQPVGDGKATQSHILVYGAIEFHAAGEKGCIASNQFIGKEVGLSSIRVSHIITELQRSGWVQVVLDDKNNRKQIIPLLKIVRGMPSVTRGVVTDDVGGTSRVTTEITLLKDSEGKAPPKYKTKFYLEELMSGGNDEDLRYFIHKYKCTTADVKTYCEKILNWQGMYGKRIKNYKLTLSQWLLKDFGNRAFDGYTRV